MKPHDIPSDVDAEQGTVIVDGPDGIAFSMTPDAARQTSERLHTGAIEAQRQADAPADDDTGQVPGAKP